VSWSVSELRRLVADIVAMANNRRNGAL